MNKKTNIPYTLIAITVITVVVVYIASRAKPATTGDSSTTVKVNDAQHKQVVKPDDIIEEAITGVVEEELVVGDQNGYGPVMSSID